MVHWAGIVHFIKKKIFTGLISCPGVVSVCENRFLPFRKLQIYSSAWQE